MSQPVCSMCGQNIFLTRLIEKCTNNACGSIVCGMCAVKCKDITAKGWCPHCSNPLAAQQVTPTRLPGSRGPRRPREIIKGQWVGAAPSTAKDEYATAAPQHQSTRELRSTGISCPSCGGDLRGRFPKCMHCRSDIYWSLDGRGFAERCQADSHDAEALAHQEQLERERANSVLAAKASAVLREITSVLKIAKMYEGDMSLSAENLKWLQHSVGNALHTIQEFRLNIASVNSPEPPQDERRYDDLEPPPLPPEIQDCYATLVRLQDFVEETVASRRGSEKSRSVTADAETASSLNRHCAAGDGGDDLDPALWQWILTATACIASADGKLGRRELQAITESVAAHKCPIASEALNAEVIASCKRVHAEGAQNIAASLCEMLRAQGNMREREIVLTCVLKVSNADDCAGERERELVKFFASNLSRET